MAMTRDEFVQKYRASSRGQTPRLGIVAALAWGISIPLIIWGTPKLMHMEEEGHFAWAASFDGYWIIGFFGFCLLVFALGSRFVRYTGGVICPICGEKLWGTGVRIAVMTGNCGNCGEKIIDDPGLVKRPEKP